MGTCPNCGYCPHCGRSAQPVYPVWPLSPSPWWQQPWTWVSGAMTVTSSEGPIVGNTTKLDLSNVSWTQATAGNAQLTTYNG